MFFLNILFMLVLSFFFVFFFSILFILCVCIGFCVVSPFVYTRSCLIPICVQVYRPLPPVGKPVVINKYHRDRRESHGSQKNSTR